MSASEDVQAQIRSLQRHLEQLERSQAAQQTGSGAVAQGDSVGAGAGGAAVGGSVQGSVIVVNSDPEQSLRYMPSDRFPLWVNVPPFPNGVIGREQILSEIVDRILGDHSSAISTAGLPGVGKSTLAILVAHDERISRRFTGGVLWVSLGQKPDTLALQMQWAEELGVELSAYLDDTRRIQRLSAAVGQRPVLVIIDDAWRIEHAQKFRLSSRGVVHLLTTRDRSLARDFALPKNTLSLPLLGEEDAWNLIRQMAPDVCAAHESEVRQIVNKVGGLPLAIELLGGYLGGIPPTALPEQKSALAVIDAPERLLNLAKDRIGGALGKAQTLDAVVKLSIQDLQQIHPPAASALFALGAFTPKPAVFSRDAALFVTGATAAVLDVLEMRNLVEGNARGELQIHQVIHDVTQRSTQMYAIEAHAEYYLNLVQCHQEDWRLIASVYPQIRRAWQRLAEDRRLYDFVWAMKSYFERRGLQSEYLEWVTRACQYAEAGSDQDAKGVLISTRAAILAMQGQRKVALSHYAWALHLVRQSGNVAVEAAVLSGMGSVNAYMGNAQQALDLCEQAVSLAEKIQDDTVRATLFNNLAGVYFDSGRNLDALACYETSLRLAQACNDREGEACVLNNIGQIHSRLGAWTEAIHHYERSMTLRQSIGDIRGEADERNNIGGALSELGDKQAAMEHYVRALELHSQISNRDGMAVALENLAALNGESGDYRIAVDRLDQAAAIRLELDDKARAVVDLNSIGALCRRVEAGSVATGYHERAWRLAQEIKNLDLQRASLQGLVASWAAVNQNEMVTRYAEELRALNADSKGPDESLDRISQSPRESHRAVGAARPWIRHYDPETPLSVSIPERPVQQLLADAAREWPNKTAVRMVFQYLPLGLAVQAKLSYRELDRLSDRFAAALQKIGVQKGSKVAIMLPNLPQQIVAFYGILKTGGVVVNVNPAYPAHELQPLMRIAGVEVMITLSGLYDRVLEVQPGTLIKSIILTDIPDSIPPILRWPLIKRARAAGMMKDTPLGPGTHSMRSLMESAPARPSPVQIDPKTDTAVFQFTGGTTGLPKAAQLTHFNMAANTEQLIAWMPGLAPGHEKLLMAVPAFHVYGMTVGVLVAAAIKSELVMTLIPRDTLHNLEVLQREKITIYPGVPSMYIAALNHPQIPDFDLRAIKVCISGGSALPAEVAEKWEVVTGGKLVEGYGLTEASPVVAANPVRGQAPAGSIGLPLPGTECAVVEMEMIEGDRYRFLPAGEEGELVVRGPQVMKGYYNNPEETANTIDKDGWLHTGDIAKMDEDGYFYIVDRKKDLIIVRGYTVVPREVEEVLFSHPKVLEAAVIGIPDARRGEVVKACVVLKEDVNCTPEELRSFCKEKLAPYKVPTYVELVKELPKTQVGKVLRRTLLDEQIAKLSWRLQQPV